MAIASQVLATTNDPLTARKPGAQNDELLISLFVVMAATMLGAVGGIWLAVRDQSTRRQEILPSSVSAAQSSQPLSVTSQPRKKDPPAGLIPMAAAKESKGKIVSLGLPSVRKIRHSYGPDRTEIAIELRAATLLRAAQLHDPERVYFDLADSGRAQKPKGRLKSRRELSVDDDRVTGIRVVRWESGAVRIVVDLKRPCKYSYRLSAEPPSLLTLEFRTSSRANMAGHKLQRKEVDGSPEHLAVNRP